MSEFAHSFLLDASLWGVRLVEDSLESSLGYEEHLPQPLQPTDKISSSSKTENDVGPRWARGALSALENGAENLASMPLAALSSSSLEPANVELAQKASIHGVLRPSNDTSGQVQKLSLKRRNLKMIRKNASIRNTQESELSADINATSTEEAKLLIRDLHDVLHRITSSLPTPLLAPRNVHVVELAVSWSRFVSLLSAIHGDGIRELTWLPLHSMERGKLWGESSLAAINHSVTKYTDGALWLYSQASTLDPRVISQATLETIGDINTKLGGIVANEISQLMQRFDRELLALKRQSVPERKNPPSCMVVGMDGEARRLNYGDAIPSLLHMKEKGKDMFETKPKVALDSDSKGNLIVTPVGPDSPDALPLSSDVMWMRQMAAYSEDVTGTSDEEASEPPSPVTVAAVTLPVNARGDVLVTQRTSRGMYNGMWVFPGGHVDGEEGVYKAAEREVLEETGIKIDRNSLTPRAMWEGAVTSKKRQFCVVFFEALALGETPKLQTKEVYRATWVPRELVPRILDTHVWHDSEIEGIRVVDGKQEHTKIKLSDLQQGLGSGHKFALKQYLEARDKKECMIQPDPAERLIPANVVVPREEPQLALSLSFHISGVGKFLRAAFQ
eukprot:CAMPEP_0181317686 /NCGR_PEP_ID=MMETSP1101-20121128/16604_1 /TAXON_ID=46948 /ORGANISM="Rhodomonas abbreviata, Strain Caron Lab Isolate" /LENGTH=616 /DNA_ID=CAMNT_0023425103 /DNA_START=119 /DNA_END=1969 /DNA_ORIENTATION=+